MKLKIDPRAARLRHARYYQQVAHRANFELYDKGKQLEGLALFDQERSQIDMVWEWVMVEPHSQESDTLLLKMANATTHVGYTRYDAHHVRIPRLEAQITAARRLESKVDESQALGNLAISYSDVGDYSSAIQCNQQALDLIRKLGIRHEEGGTLGNLAMVYSSLGDYQRAIDYLEQSLAIARDIGNQRSESYALANLGSVYRDVGDYRASIDYLEQGLILIRKHGDRRSEGTALGNLGTTYSAARAHRQAIDYYEKQLAIACELGDKHNESRALGNLGSAYNALDEYNAAIVYHEQALDLIRELGFRREEGQILEGLGNTYSKMGQRRKAINYYEQAQQITREIGHRTNEAINNWNMAVLYTAQGDLSQTTPNDLLQAELLIEKAVTLFQQIGNEVETKRMSQALISVRAKLEEYRLYPIRSQQVPKIYPYPIRLRHARHYQKRVHHINFELYSKGEQRKALSLFNQERYQIDTVWRWVTRQSYSEETDTLLLELAEAVVYIGDTYYDLRHERIPQLEAQRDTARRCRQERVEGNALGNLGIAYARLADYQQAITYYESSIAVFRNLIDIAGVARNSWNLGLVYEQQGDLTRADSYMRMYVGFLYNIGHSNAEQIAKHHRRVRRKLARQKKRPWWQFWRK